MRQAIASRIASGQYRPGDLIPTEMLFCEEFGVSRITVRQAFDVLVRDGLVERFRGRGTFVCRNPAPRSAKRSPMISVLLPNAIGSFMAQLVGGIESGLRARGYDLHLAIAHERLEHEAELVRELITKRVAGALLFTCDTEGPVNPNCMEYLRVREAGIPMLFVDRYLPPLPIGYVVTDGRAGMRQLVDHLLDLGHTSVGYMDHAVEATAVTERRRGFHEALEARRLAPRCVIRVDRPREDVDDVDLAYRAMKAHLAGIGLGAGAAEGAAAGLPTAFVGCNTYYAIGMFRALKEAGLRVPEDVSLAGFDDVPEAAVLEVPLTVFRAPVAEMGRVAAERLIDLIEADAEAGAVSSANGGTAGTGENVRIELPGRLVVRASSGVLSKEASPNGAAVSA
ncbi:MAG: GntR family transcriptional regulator [Planctomycetota bacterium]|nr:GntR family transcriptional regulator [Planctomycetota bacterium]